MDPGLFLQIHVAKWPTSGAQKILHWNGGSTGVPKVYGVFQCGVCRGRDVEERVGSRQSVFVARVKCLPIWSG